MKEEKIEEQKKLKKIEFSKQMKVLKDRKIKNEKEMGKYDCENW